MSPLPMSHARKKVQVPKDQVLLSGLDRVNWLFASICTDSVSKPPCAIFSGVRSQNHISSTLPSPYAPATEVCGLRYIVAVEFSSEIPGGFSTCHIWLSPTRSIPMRDVKPPIAELPAWMHGPQSGEQVTQDSSGSQTSSGQVGAHGPQSAMQFVQFSPGKASVGPGSQMASPHTMAG
jgi:hypothetical protein